MESCKKGERDLHPYFGGQQSKQRTACAKALRQLSAWDVQGTARSLISEKEGSIRQVEGDEDWARDCGHGRDFSRARDQGNAP